MGNFTTWIAISCKHLLLCTTVPPVHPPGIDLPSIVNELVASVLWRIQKLSDIGGIGMTVASPDLAQWLFRMNIGP
jgi:hypothetical protein